MWRYKDDEIDRAMSGLSGTEFDSLLPAIREILSENLKRGRDKKLRVNGSLADYARQIAHTIQAEYTLTQGLAQNDPDIWTKQHQALRFRAYLRLLKLGVDHREAYERANDFAQDTCLALLQARYPNDVPHAAWANRILINQILQQLVRRPDMLDNRQITVVSFEEAADNYVSEPTDEAAHFAIGEVEQAHMLRMALAQLPSDAQREVVRLKLLGWSDEEIATRLNRSVQAIYNLWFRALRDMRQQIGNGHAADNYEIESTRESRRRNAMDNTG